VIPALAISLEDFQFSDFKFEISDLLPDNKRVRDGTLSKNSGACSEARKIGVSPRTLRNTRDRLVQ
jgi:hypothetical protein